MGEYGIWEKKIDAVYDDIQSVLKVPVIHPMFHILAGYNQFLELGWKQVRFNLLTLNGKKVTDALSYPKLRVKVPEVNWPRYYKTSTLKTIQSTVNAFNALNPKLLLIVCAWAEGLAGRPNSGVKVTGAIKPGLSPEQSAIELIDVSTAPEPVQDILREVAGTHHLTDAPADFRALAHYPQFLNVAWQALRPYINSNDFVLWCERIKMNAIQYCKKLPYAVTLNKKDLEPYYTPAEVAGITGIVSVYQNLLPALIVEGEFLKRMLAGI